ncbi:MAG: translocation/assembly module TamB [Flavisolibacter sp.]|nr:translocation/assembly module TamB [Flavisolibacter sp.]
MKRIARILLKVVLFLLLFAIVLFLLLLTPPVQKFATGLAENFLQKKLQTRVEIGSISIGLPKKVVLNDIYIEDKTKDTLIAGGTIKANIELFKLFNNEVKINDLQLKNITAKVKRVLPDTAFNFQFIIDAFVTEQKKEPDTAQTAVMKLALNNLELDNFRVIYKDVITGNDMLVHVDELTAKIDTLDPYKFHFDVPSLAVNKMTARLYQSKPLVEPEPPSKDMADAAEPIAMKLNLGTITLNDIDIDYGNDVSAFYTDLNIGHLVVDGKNLDLQNQIIHLDELTMNNTLAAIRMGKKQEADVVAKEVKQEVEAEKQKPWTFRIDNINLNGNTLQFDNDNNPKQPYGMDYAHLKADSLTLHIKDFVMNPDSIGMVVTKSEMREKSGFRLDALEGEILYAQNQTYLKNLLIQTPGTRLQRNLTLEYASYDALTKNFPATMMDFDIVNSYVQVKDILTFAPQLRTQPAFSNPNAIFHFNIIGSGNMDRLHFQTLQFTGLRNTVIDAYGTLASLTDPSAAGGTFTIRRFHTTQSDIQSLTGQPLSTPQMKLPESYEITGTLAGNASNLATNLNINTSAGFIGLNGRFTNLTKPTAATYNANIRTTGLQLGSILRNPAMGPLSANISINGKGFTPDVMNTTMNGTIYAVGYNNYTYRNIRIDGSMRQNVFAVNTDISDPNIDLTASVGGTLSSNPSFTLNAMVDSVKAHNLGFATEQTIFRGKIVGNVTSLNLDYLDADVMLTNALFVSGTNRLPLDTVHLVSGHTDTAQFIRLTSPIANASMEGQYRISELGTIIQQNLQPYFSVTAGQRLPAVKPYDFRFRLDVGNSPALSSFVPDLKFVEPLHAEGRIATGQGIQALVTTPGIDYQTNQIRGLNVTVATTERGLQLNGNMQHFVSGTFNIYNTQLRATALNNVIDFSLGIDDKNEKDKYFLSGVLRQPSAGTYALQLHPDSLLLNYERWSLPPGNEIIISPKNITANNFVLQKGNQQLAIQSLNGTGGVQPLNVQFTEFRLATISGFMKSDSLFIDGTLNGTVTFRNLMEQPLFTSNLTINNLSMQQDTIGNVNFQVNNTSANNYTANITLTGRGNDVQITGTMAQQGKDVALDINTAIRQIQLNTLKGAASAFVSNMDGAINGNISLTGTLAAPKIGGKIGFNNATFNTIMFGDYRIDNEAIVMVSNEGFRFNQFSIRDSANNALTLNGLVATPNFTNYKFNLDVNSDNFKAISTTKKANKLFYGDLVLTTRLHISGTETSPKVDGSIAVNDATNFTIVLPQTEPGVVEREGVVQFVDFDAPENDTLFLTAYDSLNTTDVTGIDLSTNIDISKNAVFNVVVDAANGDFLNMRGSGQLSAGIDPSGKITLTGQYEIEEGQYQFSFNFLQRKFNIQKGSKIVWLGEPTNAQLDLTAVYIANTAPLDLVGDQISNEQRNYYLQKLPFRVLLILKDELMKPTITFDITLPEDQNYNVGSGVEETVRNRLIQLRQEPSELSKQVFAVLLLNRFVGENPFQSSGGGFNAGSIARQSVSKLLTEQLNNLAGSLIGGVDINFDVASSDDYTTGERRSRTDLNVGLSKRLLNDRLTVTVGSNFELEGPQRTNQRSNNIAGNVSANYQLSKDGRYMLRFYRRNDYEQNVEGYVIETGLGFIITVDYNRFRQIFEARRIRRDQKKAEKQNAAL